jgi:hypothetical protein
MKCGICQKPKSEYKCKNCQKYYCGECAEEQDYSCGCSEGYLIYTSNPIKDNCDNCNKVRILKYECSNCNGIYCKKCASGMWDICDCCDTEETIERIK